MRPAVSDKFSEGGYQLMYGIFLAPLRMRTYPVKLLEIGLGCDVSYGPGASALFWRQLLPYAKIWEADMAGRGR